MHPAVLDSMQSTKGDVPCMISAEAAVLFVDTGVAWGFVRQMYKVSGVLDLQIGLVVGVLGSAVNRPMVRVPGQRPSQ
jgi:hypothetical protein